MESFLFNRQLGSISSQTLAKAQNQRLLQGLAYEPNIHFAIKKPEDGVDSGSLPHNTFAHGAGVSSIEVDRWEGKYLLSGGADSSVAIWDLENEESIGKSTIYTPLGYATRTSTTASLGITQVSFYPFDSLAFLTTGYDHTLKLFSSETLQVSASFDLGSTVYSHDTSKVASHLLVACASQHPAVRLMDLRTGSGTHSLAGHSGSVLSVAWHPKNENILASGATDGTCRMWDVRKSASSLGVLDMDDSIGVTGYDGKGTGARRRERGRAHNGAVNGLAWTLDGLFLASNGHDERLRIWDMMTGANTLANFGPALKNPHMTVLTPLLVPSHLSPLGSEMIYYPNPTEILGFDMHAGNLLKRLRVPGLQRPQAAGGTVRNINNRTTALAWRAHNVEMFSSHADGTVRCWRPRTLEDSVDETEVDGHEDDAESELAERKRKREELDSIVNDLTKKRVTFS
ncbi:hypothetical protein D0869_01695 [Hortaea werneckii]|uniref:Uncharacterized protein n=1 Tax=Hortaea werneckii TaxID=91943 RepID=A0A3M6XP54_HORWE|nr:WD40 repeat-like protein [Hortaea werneckii]KAI7011281.1 WD40 repeat-like protein [Hortaea werneckii]KAI7175105.1 WD40 repeat-like protein [Hortaea werneckii]KAI7577664.1 WD40 repeat-like protein [Hortaea werneckii]KAI7667335.1 WD40 repeat-like protein [Hortaea werneckii]